MTASSESSLNSAIVNNNCDSTHSTVSNNIYCLHCVNSCRFSALSIIPHMKQDKIIYDIIQILRSNFDRGFGGVMAHMHLIFPFLPSNQHRYLQAMITDEIIIAQNIQSFEIIFEPILRRTHGTGRQYCYLVLDKTSNEKICNLQKLIMNVLCNALRNGIIERQKINSNSSIIIEEEENVMQNTQGMKNNRKRIKKNKKMKKSKKQKLKEKNLKINKALKSNSDTTCLEIDLRNTNFCPHLTIGQMTDSEFRMIERMFVEVIESISNDISSDSYPLKMKVSELYIIGSKTGGCYKIAKTMHLRAFQNKTDK